MITGAPLDNGDGSYTFQTDTGEPLVLRGDAADRAYKQAQGAPPQTAPVMPSQELVDAAKPGPDMRTAQMGPMSIDSGNTNPFGPPVSVSDALSNAFKGDPEKLRAIQNANRPAGSPEIQGPYAALSMPEQNMTAPDAPAMLRRPAEAKAGAGGAVFYQPKQEGPVSPVGPARPSGPSRPVPIQQTIQGTVPLTDEQTAEMKRAAQGRYEAAEGITDVAAEKARQEAEVRTAQVEESRKAEVEMQARESERQRVIGEKLQKIDTLAQEAAAGKIDPDHFWKDKGAETQFATAILMGVSAWAEARGGGKAYAVDMVNKAIDRDMEAQDKNLANKREALHAQTNLLGQLRQEFGDRDAAAAAFRATKLATAGAQLEEINAKNLPAEQKAKLAEFAAGLNQTYQDQMRQAGQMAYSRTEKFSGLGGAPGTPFAKSDGSFLDLGDGTSIKASSPEMATQWRQQIDNIEEIEGASKELRAELARGPGVENNAKVKLLVNNIATSLGAAKLGSSRMTGQGELENVQQILGQTGSVSSDVLGRTQAALGAVESSVKHARRRIMDAAPRYSRPYPTAKGDLVRVPLSQEDVPAPRREVNITPAGESVSSPGARAYRALSGPAASAKQEIGAPPADTTELTPAQEKTFQAWAKKNGIRDVDHPDSHYDYRGAFMAGMKAGPDRHWPDTYKQHGHETFSNESKYARPGDTDFGYWGEDDKFVKPSKKADLAELDAAIERARRDTGPRTGGR